MNTFRVLAAHNANGPRLFVAVDHFLTSDLLHHDENCILLTVDAADQTEFDGLVDELCHELQALKTTAKLHFKLNKGE